MAESSISVSPNEFNCSVCLELLNDPVTVPCGHSYCMKCISDYWDQDDQKGVHSCPQCRKTFTPRPALNKSTILAEMVEKLKATKPQAGDVECDAESCLECRNHLEQHEISHSRKRHKDVTGRPDMICPKHGKILDITCRTDQQIVCHQCKLKEIQRLYQQTIQKRETELQELRAGVESYKVSFQQKSAMPNMWCDVM